MQWIVDHFYLFILALGVTHFFMLLALWAARQRRARDLSFYLYNLVKHFSNTPDRHPDATLHDEIDTFIADIREVVHDKSRAADRGKLYYRLVVKDEAKPDVRGAGLETYYNVARTGIEAYPLLGILGTIFAIALGLNAPRHAAAAYSASDGTAIIAPAVAAGSPAAPGSTTQPAVATVPSVAADPNSDDGLSAATSGAIIRNFANSIWSTASGIGFAIILMVVNAFIEPGFDRLVTHRRNVREVIASAKITLGLGSPEHGTPAAPAFAPADDATAPRAANGGAAPGGGAAPRRGPAPERPASRDPRAQRLARPAQEDPDDFGHEEVSS